MELTLQQARNLEKTIESRTLNNVIHEVRSFNEDVIEEDFNKVYEDFIEDVLNHLDLIDIRLTIKNLINEKNMECGVSLLLNERDKAYAEKGLLESLDKYMSSSEAQLTSALKTKEPTYRISGHTEVSDMIFSPIKSEAIKDISNIQTKLNELNTTVTIKICDQDVETLHNLKII